MGGELQTPRPNASGHSGRASRLQLKALPGMFRRASTEWMNVNTPRLGAAVAFYALLSLVPVIVIAIAVAAVVYGRDAAQGGLALEIRGLAGPDVARTVEDIIKGAYQPNMPDCDFARFGDIGIWRIFDVLRVARCDEHNLGCSASARANGVAPAFTHSHRGRHLGAYSTEWG